jgi:hypothetical protein
MGGARSTHGRDEINTIFWFQNLERREHLEDLGFREKILLEWILG